MVSWSSKTKPTPANIRHRVSAAQEAIDGAIDLIKARCRAGQITETQMQRLIKRLINANAWLIEVQRGIAK